jgi:hypothetical protein
MMAARPDALVDDALHLALADEDRDAVAELLADALLAALNVEDQQVVGAAGAAR